MWPSPLPGVGVRGSGDAERDRSPRSITLWPRGALLERTRLVFTTPALRARQADNQHATRELFVGAARAGLPAPTFAQEVQAAAALAAMTTALETWSAGHGSADLVALVDEAFRVLQAG